MAKKKAPKPPPYKEELMAGDLVEFLHSYSLERSVDHLQGTLGIVISNKYNISGWFVFCQHDDQKRWVPDINIRKVNYK